MATTNFVNAVTLTDAGWFNDVDTMVYGNLGSVTGTNTVTASGPNGLSAYALGQVFRFIPANTNTGAVTLNVSSLGAKNVYTYGAACTGGELKINVPCMVMYDGTQFNITSEHQSTGTFTPAIDFGGGSTGITYTTQVGSYTRIGDRVLFNLHVLLSNKGSSAGNMRIINLPFTSLATAGYYQAVSVGFYNNLASVAGGIAGYIANNTTYITLVQTTTGAPTILTDANCNNTSNFIISGQYQV
jgi:hypothetical protein